MKNQIPDNLRRWEERAAALKVADALLRADRKRTKKMVANDARGGLTKKAAPTVSAGPQPLRLTDLKKAFAARERLQRNDRAGGIRHIQGPRAKGQGVLYLPSGKIKRFRLALATKPYDVFFFIEVPSQNLDNGWNTSAIAACEQAKILWTQASSRKEEGIDSYKVDKARNQEAFPEPRWPRQSLEELINKTFMGRMIIVADHPALLRLIGDKQSLS